MQSPYDLVLLLFAHWVGDFLMQSNEMAENKFRSFKWLSIHVAAYSAPIFVVACLLLDWRDAALFVALNASLHWLTDAVTSRLAHRVRDKPKSFFPVIGFDQFIHASTLILTFEVYR
jgi:hypothetical protein